MFRKSTGLAAVIVLSVAVGGAVLATSGSFDPHGKPPTKGYVAVEAYKWLRDNAPDAIAGCEKTVDRFDDLRQPGVSKFKREAINCLDSVGFFDNYPVADPTPRPGQDIGAETHVEPFVVQVRSGTSTELELVFEAVVRVGETRAYDFGIRTKDPRGRWIEACKTFRNTSGRAGPAVFEQGFSGLEPGTVYEVRYRYRNSSQCGRGSPTAWSAIGQGTTGAEESGSSSRSFRAGDAIPGFPAGFSALSGAFRNGVQVTAVGGVVTITMSNGGTAEYADATYTCASAGGCVIEDGRVIRGIVIAS